MLTLTHSVSDSVTLITSRASCDAKKAPAWVFDTFYHIPVNVSVNYYLLFASIGDHSTISSSILVFFSPLCWHWALTASQVEWTIFGIVLWCHCKMEHCQALPIFQIRVEASLRGAFKIVFRKKLGIWPNQRTPPLLPVSWAAKKRRRKKLMFILHFRLF